MTILEEINARFDKKFHWKLEPKEQGKTCCCEEIKQFWNKEIKKLMVVIHEDLKLWRPIFYLDKVTKRDLKELRKMLKDIGGGNEKTKK